jgi:acyl-CoA:acyl-CoA alkyltransferase
MRFSQVSILGLAHVDAPHRIPSSDIEDRLARVSERIGGDTRILTQLTGIHARRYWDPDVRPSQVAALAGEKAIADAGIDRSQIGVVINTSVCKDFIEPAVSAFVHQKLGLSPDCQGFDLGNACLAFLNGIAVAGYMIERGEIDYGLVVDGESARIPTEATIQRLLEPGVDGRAYRDNFATLTLGSGAAAVVLCRSDLAPPHQNHRVVGAVSLAASQHADLCKGTPEKMTTDAGALLTAGVELAKRTFEKARLELGWSPAALQELILHQVSSMHTSTLCETLGLNHDLVYLLYPEFGNIGPASIPIALSKSREEGRLSPGKRVGLLGIGSGLNCTMMEVVW